MVVAERTAPRVTRMLGIVTHLERHGEATVADLAAHFGVSEQQIRKDVELLWVSGVPGGGPQDLIDFDAWAFDDDVVRLVNSQGVGQVRLSPREAVALIGALGVVVAGGVAPEAAHSALAKLKEAVGDGDAVRSVPVHPADPALAQTLRDAMERSVVVDLVYIDANDARTERTIEPHRLVVVDGATYIECFCRRANDYRTLRLDRIYGATLGTQPIVMAPSEASGFSLVPQFEATIVAARSARWLLDTFPGVEVADTGEEVTATFGVSDVSVIAGQLLAIGPQLRRIQPAPLAAEVSRQAAAALAALA